jgi:hypothetical protein
LVLTSKKESLELAPQWKQHFAPSTNNIWLDYVRRVSATTAISHVYKNELCAIFDKAPWYGDPNVSRAVTPMFVELQRAIHEFAVGLIS